MKIGIVNAYIPDSYFPIFFVSSKVFPFLVSGSIIVSLVLSLPTVGPLLYKALLAQDLFLAGAYG